MTPGSIWYEVTVDGVTGWADSSLLAFEGDTDDVTAQFVGAEPLPETETMLEMGQLVAQGFAPPDGASRTLVSAAPTVGDLGEVTYDLVGLGDDSTVGYRLHVFGTPAEDDEGFVLKSIERTEYCGRGVAEGVCV